MESVYPAARTGSLLPEPLPESAEDVVLAVLRLAEEFRAAIGDALQPHGITLQQYNILRILLSAGEKGISTLSVRAKLVERKPGITRLLDRMETQHWVTRRRCQNDRRIVYVSITDDGRRLLDKISVPLGELVSRIKPVFPTAAVANAAPGTAKLWALRGVVADDDQPCGHPTSTETQVS